MMDTEAPVCISRIDEGSLAACTSCFATVPTMRSQWHAMGCDWSSADPDVPGGMPQHYLWPWGTLLWHCCDIILWNIMKKIEKATLITVRGCTRSLLFELAMTCCDHGMDENSWWILWSVAWSISDVRMKWMPRPTNMPRLVKKAFRTCFLCLSHLVPLPLPQYASMVFKSFNYIDRRR